MLLEGRNAIVYGGGGAVGGAIARAFAREGARVFLAGRTAAALERVAGSIRAAGGVADVAVVDALDAGAVDAHAAAVAHTAAGASGAGGIDISVNVISDSDVQGTPLVDLSLADYVSPVVTAVSSKVLTSRAAARHMVPRGSGVILFFGGSGPRTPQRAFYTGGMVTAFEAVESLRRQLATELAAAGIRVVTLRTNGVPESIAASSDLRATVEAAVAGETLTGRAATLDDVGNVAVFAASDWARTITGAEINMTGGAILD